MPKGGHWDESHFAQELAVVAVIDPAESGDVVSFRHLGCRAILIPSDNEAKHYHNVYKSLPILYTDPPTENEALAITLQLWDFNSVDSINTTPLSDKLLVKLIRQRILLVGPFPRYLASANMLMERVLAIQDKVAQILATSSEIVQITAWLQKEFRYESGRLQSTHVDITELPVGDYPQPWLRRAKKRSELLPLASYMLFKLSSDALKVSNALKGASSAGDFFETIIAFPALLEGGVPVYCCNLDGAPKAKTLKPSGERLEIILPARELRHVAEDNKLSGYQALFTLGDVPEPPALLKMPRYFPVIDFAFARNHWANAKTGKNKNIDCGKVLKFLFELGVVKKNAQNSWVSNQDNFKAVFDIVSPEKGTKISFEECHKGDLHLIRKHVAFRLVVLDPELIWQRQMDEIKNALTEHHIYIGTRGARLTSDQEVTHDA